MFLECYADEALLRNLGLDTEDYTHSHGKGKVVKFVEDRMNSIGLVDEDPDSVQPKYLISMKESQLLDYRLIKREDKVKNNLIIVISPRLEEWIIFVLAEANNLNYLENEGLPTDPEALHTKLKLKKNAPKFANAIKALVKNDNKHLLKLKEIIKGFHRPIQ